MIELTEENQKLKRTIEILKANSNLHSNEVGENIEKNKIFELEVLKEEIKQKDIEILNLKEDLFNCKLHMKNLE